MFHKWSFRLTHQYDLLTPLLHLYRHGHIQKHDPVALPPLQSSQLPSVLQPQGDSEKGQNVWLLGSKVASKLVDLPLLAPGYLHLSNNAAAKRKGSLQIANYIVGSFATSMSLTFPSSASRRPTNMLPRRHSRRYLNLATAA